MRRRLIRSKGLLIAIPVLSVVVFSVVYLVWAYNPGTNITVCTSTVDQSACYTDYPRPTLNWTISGTSWQTQYQVQIDDNMAFNSPDIDTGWVVSTDHLYTVTTAGLDFEKNYFWRVRVRDNRGSITGWAQGADTMFTTASQCQLEGEDLTVSKGNYCTSPSHFFSWTYSDPEGKNQSRYRFQVDDNVSFNSPEVDRDRTGLDNPNLTVNNEVVSVAESPGSDQLGYNTTYYWRVKVWNSDSDESEWIEGSSFTTESHRYPSVNLSWSPSSVQINEDVLFTDESTVYGGATKAAWAWTFEDGNPSSSSQQNPTIQFSSIGSKQVTLTVTDSDGFSCPLGGGGYMTLSVLEDIPSWKEILPW